MAFSNKVIKRKSIALGVLDLKGQLDRELAQKKYDQYKAEAKDDDFLLKQAYGKDIRTGSADFIQVDEIH